MDSVKARVLELSRKLEEAREFLDATDHTYNPKRYKVTENIVTWQQELDNLQFYLETLKPNNETAENVGQQSRT